MRPLDTPAPSHVIPPNGDPDRGTTKSAEPGVGFDVIAIDLLPDPVLWIAFSGRVVRANTAALRLMGHSAEVLTTLHVWDFDVHMTREAWESRDPFHFPEAGISTEYRHPDGSLYPVHIHGGVAEVGGELHHLAVLRDIGEFRRLEREARDAVAQARVILDHVPDIAWMKGLDGRFLAVNRAFADAFGRPAAEFIGLTDTAITTPEVAARYRSDDARVIATGEVVRVEEPLTPNGPRRGWIETIKTPVKDDDGAVIATVGVARDITERAEAFRAEMRAREGAETALREQRALMETLIDAATANIFVKDLAGRYILVNSHFVRWGGWADKDSLIGKTVFDLFPREVAERLTADDQRIFTERRPIEFEENIQHPNGDRTVLSLKVPLLNADGEPYALCCVATDITLRKEGERLMEVARDEAERASRAKSEFLCMMSHELRTPLNAIIGFAEILGLEVAGPLTDEQRLYVTNIEQGGEHLLEIVSDILEFARAEADQLVLEEEEVTPHELLAACVALGNGVRHDVRLEVAPNTPRIWVDSLRMRQVMINLLGNAVKFSDPGTIITLGAAPVVDGGPENGGVVLTVADHGIGIEEADIPRVMEMFAQVDASMRRHHEGTGVGLPLAVALTRAHGGRLTLESAVGVGTAARVWLPPERVIKGEG